jgi:hypothetical protein
LVAADAMQQGGGKMGERCQKEDEGEYVAEPGNAGIAVEYESLLADERQSDGGKTAEEATR